MVRVRVRYIRGNFLMVRVGFVRQVRSTIFRTFPAEQYTVQYILGNGVTVRVIMIDTTLMCGSGASHFGKLQTKNEEKYREEIKVAKKHMNWLKQELREARKV